MTDDILSKMDEPKTYENANRYKCNQLNKEIINDCRNTKENWLSMHSEEIEELTGETP